MVPLKIVVIGLGHQSVDDHLPAVQESERFVLIGVVDKDAKKAEEIAREYGVPGYTSHEDLLREICEIDVALVAVPHSEYVDIIELVAERGIHVIKEKPFAASIEDAKRLISAVIQNDINLTVTLQRRFNPIFQSFRQLARRIGGIFSIEGKYVLNIARLDEGWRASRLYAQGGALIDLGYHYVDLIIWYFGLPDTISCNLSTRNRPDQEYDVEDTADVSFQYNTLGGDDGRTLGSLRVSRVYGGKEEHLIATGSHGSVHLQRGRVERRGLDGSALESLDRSNAWPAALVDQLESFADDVLDPSNLGVVNEDYLKQAAFVEAAYESARRHEYVDPNDIFNELTVSTKVDRPAIVGGSPTCQIPVAFQWPTITRQKEEAVLTQLRDTLSIYDRSGVFGRFEDEFAKFHSREHALLSNSGTSSIHAMFDAIGLMPGDEVLCPVYTFHATVSPMMQTGAIPKFCDCDAIGNVTLDEIKLRRTPQCKAVIVTHMWGAPVAEIDAIAQFCKDENLYLLEDCSHAHGASIHGQPVGSFGDMAAWSLQGQKIISGGEGGILVTDNRDLYNRSLLQGHYNKRPKNEIEVGHALSKYFLTGQGLKLRAHPIAVAFALNEFRNLDAYVAQKSKYALEFERVFSKFPFIEIRRNGDCQQSWYAFTFHFNRERAFGVTREEFVEALHMEGLVEFDIPGSTGLLNKLPLFLEPQGLIPRLYKNGIPPQESFPNAEEFCSSLVKLPVWARPEDEQMIRLYLRGFEKVSHFLMHNEKLNTIDATDATQ